MKNLIFKTNINCGGCVAKVTPFLNEEFQAGNWEVDFLNPAKILQVKGDGILATEVEAVVMEAGFKAEFIREETFN